MMAITFYHLIYFVSCEFVLFLFYFFIYSNYAPLRQNSNFPHHSSIFQIPAISDDRFPTFLFQNKAMSNFGINIWWSSPDAALSKPFWVDFIFFKEIKYFSFVILYRIQYLSMYCWWGISRGGKPTVSWVNSGILCIVSGIFCAPKTDVNIFSCQPV